jgi:hypothetical protein
VRLQRSHIFSKINELQVSVLSAFIVQFHEKAIEFHYEIKDLYVQNPLCTKLTKQSSIQWSTFDKIDYLTSSVRVPCNIGLNFFDARACLWMIQLLKITELFFFFHP